MSVERWRLVLGHYSEKHLPDALDRQGARMDRALDYLYGREYEGRGVRPDGSRRRAGGLGPSWFTVPRWLGEVRKLFPKSAVEIIERDALGRYQLVDVLKDPKALSRVEPDVDLAAQLLAFRGRLKGELLEQARQLIERVVAELRRQLENEIRRAFSGRIDRFRRSRLKVAQNLDWRRTIHDNLKQWDPEKQRLVIDQLHFFSRVRRHIPWTVILCVDQSASMAGSMVHSAVMASALAGVPAVAVRMVLFDTSVVDVTDRLDEPVDLLLSVQLGGGTDIGRALAYCEQLVEDPRRTILAVVSDFEEGGSPRRLLAAVRRLTEAGVRLPGLAALDRDANPWYDRRMAERLVAHGMEVAALTPEKLARWLAAAIRRRVGVWGRTTGRSPPWRRRGCCGVRRRTSNAA